MPRQIIDTESSRPAYIRRRLITTIIAIVAVAVVAVAIALAYEAWASKRAVPVQIHRYIPEKQPVRRPTPPPGN